MSFMEFDNAADVASIRRFRGGSDEAAEEIVERYKELVRYKARPYNLLGADAEDVIQEGMVGLFKAMKAYDLDSPVPFGAFATVCIKNQIESTVKSYKRIKHQFLNDCISLDQNVTDEDGSEVALISLIPDSQAPTPEEALLQRENQSLLETLCRDRLTPLEKRVLALYLEGSNYKQIADAIGKNTKAVDNALGRIKTKIHDLLTETETEK